MSRKFRLNQIGVLAAMLAFAGAEGCDKFTQWVNPPPDEAVSAAPVALARGDARFADTARLLKEHKFRTSRKLYAVPLTLTQTSSIAGEPFRIADYDGEWASSDYVARDTIPRRRLLFVANYSNIWVLVYEHSRNARHTHIAFFEMAGNKISYYWSALSMREVNSFDDVQQIIADPGKYIFKSASDTKLAGDDL